MKTTTEANTARMRKIQATLTLISMGTKTFFNVAQYKNHDLITVKKKWGTNAVGNKVQIGTMFQLTAKGRSFMSVVV